MRGFYFDTEAARPTLASAMDRARPGATWQAGRQAVRTRARNIIQHRVRETAVGRAIKYARNQAGIGSCVAFAIGLHPCQLWHGVDTPIARRGLPGYGPFMRPTPRSQRGCQ